MARHWTDYSDNEVYALCMGIGIGLGLGIGTLFNLTGAGLAIGLGLGVAAAEFMKRSRDSHRARRRSGPDSPA